MEPERSFSLFKKKYHCFASETPLHFSSPFLCFFRTSFARDINDVYGRRGMTSNVRLLPPLAANIAVGRARRASGRGITATIPQREGQFLCPVTKARPSRGTFCFAAEGAQGAGVETSPDADQTTFTILARNCRGVLQVCLFVDSTRQRRPTRYFSLLNENARQTRFTSFSPSIRFLE